MVPVAKGWGSNIFQCMRQFLAVLPTLVTATSGVFQKILKIGLLTLAGCMQSHKTLKFISR
jgi:hypothetical protein